jgi:tetratricopeptide (TPR) repeat protein
MINRRAFFLPAILLILLAAGVVPASAKETWTSVRSKNFFLIGNASEKEIRQVATRLEQFRDVFTRLFSQIKFTSPVPTTVVVFKSESAYKPFNPRAVAGYFQPGQDVNYITLSTERRGEENPYHTIFHEYVHLLVNNTMENAPAWFNEGLAEYYSTFEIEDDRKVYLGKVIGNHVLYLRDQKMLPLRTLLAVDHSSPHYNESSKRGVFYAQSWALVHYMILGNNQQRLPQFGVFLDLLAKDTPVEKAFNEAFQTTYETLEKELKNYINKSTYPARVATFEKKLEFDAEMQAAPLTEAEAQSYLGDLLLHIGNLGDAEKRLQQALQLDPNLALANSSLGMVRVRQGKFAEAKPLLQKAANSDSKNYLVHYNYALALSLEGMDANNRISGYTDEVAEAMRAQLKKAIELSPAFPDSYRLLAFINLVRGEEIDESIALVKRGLAISPGRGDFSFMLAQLYMRKQDFKGARQILEPMARSSGADKQLRANAQYMLDSINRIEAEMSGLGEDRSGADEGEASSSDSRQRPALRRRGESPGETSQQEGVMGGKYEQTGYLLPIRQPEAGEEQVLGLLLRLDCDSKGVTFIVKVGERQLKLRAVNFDNIYFATYTPEVAGEIRCGARNPANHAVITFRPAKEARAKFDGEPVAVEFVPKDFELKRK